MTTSFSSLPIVDLSEICLTKHASLEVNTRLGQQLYDVFATTGFAYLVNSPLTFSHTEIFNLARSFFHLPLETKMQLAKRTFQSNNNNTYRGYFPIQPLGASDNLKEGFEIGPVNTIDQSQISSARKGDFNLSEPNPWPSPFDFPHRTQLEGLYTELQNLSSQLLSALALSLGKDLDFFAPYLTNSVSTLRLLHYPPINRGMNGSTGSTESLASDQSFGSCTDSHLTSDGEQDHVKLSCTPHTDSGIITLLHQDSTGGLEVRNSNGQWVSAPYLPGSIVVNIGDLMAEVSGGRFIATMHRVRAPMSKKLLDGGGEQKAANGRFSIPFFFEPGEECIVRSVDDKGDSHGILYGEHVRNKMKTWVEFQDLTQDSDSDDNYSETNKAI